MAALAALAAAAAVAARCNETKSKMKWSFIEFEVIGGFTRLVQGLRSMKCFGWKNFDNYFCFIILIGCKWSHDLRQPISKLIFSWKSQFRMIFLFFNHSKSTFHSFTITQFLSGSQSPKILPSLKKNLVQPQLDIFMPCRAKPFNSHLHRKVPPSSKPQMGQLAEIF